MGNEQPELKSFIETYIKQIKIFLKCCGLGSLYERYKDPGNRNINQTKARKRRRNRNLKYGLPGAENSHRWRPQLHGGPNTIIFL